MIRDSLIFLTTLLLIAFGTESQCPFWTAVPVDLGNDTVICHGEPFTLNFDASSNYTYDFYSWSIGNPSPAITVNTAGTYSVECGMIGPNVVVNGDFENGATGFNSGYTPGLGGFFGVLSLEGTYDISTSPSLSHNNFTPCGDNTSGAGNMMVVNGSANPGTSIWCQTVNVTPNTDYLFSSWATNALNDPNVAILQFSINGVAIGDPFAPSPFACNWMNFNAVWNSGANITADICIVNLNIATGGNDFAIDDIRFSPICTVTDEIVVSLDNINVDAGSDVTFCPNKIEELTAVSSDPTASFSWNGSSTGAVTTPDTTGWYVVKATSANGCQAQDSAYVDIIPMNWSIDTIVSGPSVCGLNDGFVSVTMEGMFDVLPLYNWSGPGQNSTNQIDATVFQNLSPGWYYLTVESNGCFLYDSMLVEEIDSPIASFSASPVSGTSPLSVTFQNNSQNANEYFWDFGNTHTETVFTLSAQNQTYTETGTYQVALVATSGSCSDTAYQTIVVIDPQVILPTGLSAPNVFTPNDDQINDVFVFETLNIERMYVVVLNRWGNVMFESTEVDFSWDGTVDGKQAAEGTYFYRYAATGIQGEQFEDHGFVQLVRSN